MKSELDRLIEAVRKAEAKLEAATTRSAVAVEQNPDYCDGAPQLKGIIFRPVADADARVSEMLWSGST